MHNRNAHKTATRRLGASLSVGQQQRQLRLAGNSNGSYQMKKLLMRLRVGVQVGLTRRTGPQQELVCC